ncbi:MAG TPA: kelch repeat-containing protein, partial [bacterium]|nr:kelch repeat-containing protein [bacterium]
MKKCFVLGIILMAMFFSLYSQSKPGDSPIDWVTGPGSSYHGNVKAELLPYGACYGNVCYVDENPIIWETDIGKPITDASGNNILYILFGDTAMLKKNSEGVFMTEVGTKSSTDYYYTNPEEEDYIETKVSLQALTAADQINDSDEFIYVDYENDSRINYFDQCQYFWNPVNYDIINNRIPYISTSCRNSAVPFMFRSSASVNIDDTVDNCISAQPDCFDLEFGSYFNRNWCEHMMASCFQQQGYYNNNYSIETPKNGYNSNLNTVIFNTNVSIDPYDDRIRIALQDQVSNYGSSDIAKSIRKSTGEDENRIMVYPVDYFYVCPGTSTICPDSEKKLIIPSISLLWSVYTQSADDLVNTAMSYGGMGLYNFNDECRIDFADSLSPNNVTCLYSGRMSTTNHRCADRPEPKYINSQQHVLSNPNVMWYLGGKFTTTTVIKGLKRDMYTESLPGFNKEYIYFLGVGELCGQGNTVAIEGYCGDIPANRPTGNVYLARVPASEYEIGCTGSYEYFIEIKNGVSKWGSYEDARPLYDLTIPQSFIGSVVKKDGLYWMTVPIREENERGFWTYASPDGINWRLADKIVSDLTSYLVKEMYGFNFMPQTTEMRNRQTIPYLYNIWKTQSGYNDSYNRLDPDFPVYNVALGEYNHKPVGKESRSFMVYSKNLGDNPFRLSLFAPNQFRVNFNGVQNISEIADNAQRAIAGKKNVMVQYCKCESQDEQVCKKTTCDPSLTFDPENPEIENWRVMNYVDTSDVCSFSVGTNQYEYLCRIPFNDSVNSFGAEGAVTSAIWDLSGLIVDPDEINLPGNTDKLKWGDNIILRLSFWDRLTPNNDEPPVENSYEQLLDNIKLSPSPSENNPQHWKTTGLITLKKQTTDENIPSKNTVLEPPIIELINYDTLAVSRIRNVIDPSDPDPAPYDWGMVDLFSNSAIREGSLIFSSTATSQPAQNFLAASLKSFSSSSGKADIKISMWGGSASTTQYQTYSYNPFTNLPVANELILFQGELDHETGNIIMNQINLVEFEGTRAPRMTDAAHLIYDERNDILYLVGAPDKAENIGRIYRLDKMMIGDYERYGWTYVSDFNIGKYSAVAKMDDRRFIFTGGIQSELAAVVYSDKVHLFDLDDPANHPQVTTIPGGGRAKIATVGEGITGKLYIYGGENASGLNNDLMEYDLNSDTWRTIQTTYNSTAGGPEGRKNAHLFINRLTDELLLNGGIAENSADMGYDWTLDLASENWTSKKNSSEPSYCLNETNDLLKGGFDVSGTCTPFTHPWYKQFSAGATVYSVAGKGDRLYVGTSNSIKVYDISDPNALTLKYTFSTSSRIVYDLEIADGDVMYAATSNGLYKLNTANPDTLSVIGS